MLTAAEAAAHAGVSVDTIYRRIRAGDLPAYSASLARGTLVKREDVDALSAISPITVGATKDYTNAERTHPTE